MMEKEIIGGNLPPSLKDDVMTNLIMIKSSVSDWLEILCRSNREYLVWRQSQFNPGEVIVVAFKNRDIFFPGEDPIIFKLPVMHFIDLSKRAEQWDMVLNEVSTLDDLDARKFLMNEIFMKEGMIE